MPLTVSSLYSLWHRLCWAWCGIWPAVDAAMMMNLMTKPCLSSLELISQQITFQVIIEQ